MKCGEDFVSFSSREETGCSIRHKWAERFCLLGTRLREYSDSTTIKTCWFAITGHMFHLLSKHTDESYVQFRRVRPV